MVTSSAWEVGVCADATKLAIASDTAVKILMCFFHPNEVKRFAGDIRPSAYGGVPIIDNQPFRYDRLDAWISMPPACFFWVARAAARRQRHVSEFRFQRRAVGYEIWSGNSRCSCPTMDRGFTRTPAAALRRCWKENKPSSRIKPGRRDACGLSLSHTVEPWGELLAAVSTATRTSGFTSTQLRGAWT